MTTTEPAARIRAVGGRATRPRIAVLTALDATVGPTTHAELGVALRSQDRVTLYRALQWLVDNDLAVRVVGADGTWRFASRQVAGEHAHPHFQCRECGRLVCLQRAPLPSVSVPDGFHLDEVRVQVTGICDACV